jgi:hypothetical protein
MRLFASLLVLTLFASSPVLAVQEVGKAAVLDIGTQLNAVALNGLAATRTFTVGPKFENENVLGYTEIVLEHFFDYTANAGTITTSCLVGRTAATATFSPTTCTTSLGVCSVNLGGTFVTASLSSDTKYSVRMRVAGYPTIKCTVTHGGTPGATDKITVTGYLLKD